MTDSSPALDPAYLSGLLKRTKTKEQSAHDMLTNHLAKNPRGFISWSGGKDSTAAVVLAKRIAPEIPVVFFDSGIEYPENIEYLQKITDLLDLNFHIIHTGDVLGLIIEHAWYDHYRDARDVGVSMREVKIEMPSARAHEIYGPGRIWGLRADESNGRAALLRPTRGTTRYLNGQVACAPLWNWSSSDVTGFLSKEGIPENPIYTRLTEIGVPIKEQRAGALFDGGLDFGRITWLKRGWPHLYDKLKQDLPRLEEYR